MLGTVSHFYGVGLHLTSQGNYLFIYLMSVTIWFVLVFKWTWNFQVQVDDGKCFCLLLGVQRDAFQGFK